MDEPEGNEPYFLDEPRRYEEEMLARARRVQAELKALISQDEKRMSYWDRIFVELSGLNARNEQERTDVTHCEE